MKGISGRVNGISPHRVPFLLMEMIPREAGAVATVGEIRL